MRKTYRLGRLRVPVLHGVDLSVGSGECVCILGASGSGKSTLLHLMGGLDRPDRPDRADRSATGQTSGDAARSGQTPRAEAGSIRFDGLDLTRTSAARLDRYRASDVGFVFQFYHLLPELTVLENVTVAGMVRHGLLGYAARRDEVKNRATELLDLFGLSHRLRHRPAELSGGERQRVAIARALANRPRLLLADEPTGNLDQRTGGLILDAVMDARRELGLTIVLVTHDEQVAARADRVLRLRDGRFDEPAPLRDAALGVPAALERSPVPG